MVKASEQTRMALCDPDLELAAQALEGAPGALWGILAAGARGSCRLVGTTPEPRGGGRASAWLCRVWTPFGKFQTPFSQGSGYQGRPPLVMDVCESLLRDAAMLDEMSSPEEAICSGLLGLVEDLDRLDALREARRAIAACEGARARMARALGPYAPCEGAADAARVADALAPMDKDLGRARADRPLGALELAAAAGLPDLVAKALERCRPGPEALAEAARAARAFDQTDSQCAEQILLGLAERAEIARGLAPKAHRSTSRAPSL